MRVGLEDLSSLLILLRMRIVRGAELSPIHHQTCSYQTQG
ncbi:hypothetical protein NPIL_4311, partial [Nephila pilipes]